MNKSKIDFNQEYSNTNLCSEDTGGCGYDKSSCVCEFRKSYNQKQTQESDVSVQEAPISKPDLGGRS